MEQAGTFTAGTYSVYRDTVSQIMQQQEQLPSLPALTLEVRQAANNPNTTYPELTRLVKRDPSLCALLMKHAQHSYSHEKSPKGENGESRSLENAMAHLGFDTITNLVVLHCVRSLFTTRSQSLRKSFAAAWKRMAFKACMSQFIATHLYYRPKDEAFIAALLSEIGRMGILSTFKASTKIPSPEDFEQLYNSYSQSVGRIMLHNWGMDKDYIEITQLCGQWDKTANSNNPKNKLSLLDIVNLAHYHTDQQINPSGKRIPLQEIAAYKKIPNKLNAVSPSGQLQFIIDHKAAFKGLLRSMSA
ncbi:MAG: HDOD domain-containing protein [Cellvibrionaceae bacterium]